MNRVAIVIKHQCQFILGLVVYGLTKLNASPIHGLDESAGP
jgi:hypothetical protein